MFDLESEEYKDYLKDFNEIKQKLGLDKYDKAREEVRDFLNKQGSENQHKFYFVGDRLNKSLNIIDISDNPKRKYSSWYVQILMIEGFLNRLSERSYQKTLKGSYSMVRFCKIFMPHDLDSLSFTYSSVKYHDSVDDFYESVGTTRKSRALSKFIFNSKDFVVF